MTARTVPIRNAATLMLLRDSGSGLQVYLLRRNLRTVFGPGMYVFPGGALDDADAEPGLIDRCDGLTQTQARAMLGGAADGLALWVAAIRECFEEAGVLIATNSRGVAPGSTPELALARRGLNAGELGFGDLCRSLDLRLPVSRLHYYSHWITPQGAPRRFSTRFFACDVEEGQQAAHDGSETVAGEWITPEAAVSRYESGDMPMMPPTIVQMRFLTGYGNTADAMREIKGIATIPSERETQ